MNILIAKQSEELFLNSLPKAKKVTETKNTVTLSITKAAFEKFYTMLTEWGENPYALMNW